jgi:hypothetical protein
MLGISVAVRGIAVIADHQSPQRFCSALCGDGPGDAADAVPA